MKFFLDHDPKIYREDEKKGVENIFQDIKLREFKRRHDCGKKGAIYSAFRSIHIHCDIWRDEIKREMMRKISKKFKPAYTSSNSKATYDDVMDIKKIFIIIYET